jgi:hypothetical protein
MSVKKLLPPQAMRGILLRMLGLVRSYVTFAILCAVRLIYTGPVYKDKL